MAKKCLIICPFGPEGSEIRKRSDKLFEKLIKPVVNEEGYDGTYRLIDDAQPGSIGKQMIQDLYSADLVIADLSGSNPNVFYELALRHSVAKPFIHISDNVENIPFDIKEISVIKFGMDIEEAMNFKDKLKDQIQKINRGEGHFENLTSELRPIHSGPNEPKGEFLVRAFRWSLEYSASHAREWLNLQEEGLKNCIKEFLNDPSKVPSNLSYREGLAEYLAYRVAQGQAPFGDLYYVLDNNTAFFEGWGNFVIPGTSQLAPLAINVHGVEQVENNNRLMIVEFSQPSRKIAIAPGIEHELRSFNYSMTFRKDLKNKYFTSEFYHPDYINAGTKLLIGRSKLIPKT